MSTKEKWRFVSKYPVVSYECGVHAGDRVRLRRNIPILDWKGHKTGIVHKRGEIWTVLAGAPEKRPVVWLKQADGERHTWDDDERFWQTFERAATNMTYSEFWKLYHREDPNEALAYPHRLRVHLSDGSRHDVLFPGSLLATDTKLIVGVGPRAKKGESKSTIFCPWEDVVKIETVLDRQHARAMR